MSKNEVVIGKEEAVLKPSNANELRKIFSSDRLNDYLDSERKKLEDKLIDEAEYKNEILWLIDHLYVPGESSFEKYLNDAEIYYDDYDGTKPGISSGLYELDGEIESNG